MPAQRLPQALLVSNQANRERLGIAQGSFRLALRFPQPHTRTAAILSDELDAGGFESAVEPSLTRSSSSQHSICGNMEAGESRSRSAVLRPTSSSHGDANVNRRCLTDAPRARADMGSLTLFVSDKIL